MNDNTVTINGVVYDKHTGMPIAKASSVTPAISKKPRAAQSAQSIHHRTQKSTTLNRRYVHHTAPKQPTTAPKTSSATHAVTVKTSHTARPPVSPHQITRFAKHPAGLSSHATVSRSAKPADIAAPVVHPMVQRVTAASAAKKPAAVVPKPSHIIKNEAIEKSLSAAVSADPKSRRRREKAAKKSAKATRGRTMRLATAGVALFLVAGYFTYLNMPNLSVRVAAAQAGIGASYPSYRPSGYSLSGPVAFNQGQVSMKFAMNGGNQSFTLMQAKSSWDSAAVQNNYVIPTAGDNYSVTQANGLTIYTFGDEAAWVNGNILYTIKGDAALSDDQIQRIATSL